MDTVLHSIGICPCFIVPWLDILMVLTLCGLLLLGYPAAFSLAGTALLFAVIGLAFNVFDISFLTPYPQRIFGAITNTTLIAIPLFILMGVILEKAKIAEDLLDAMAKLFGSLRGGLGISVTIVGALLAASTGIVGATVVTMGLLSLPTMLKRGYDPAFASGSIAAAGTLGQIIPPSIVLILLGDAISNAYQKSQLAQGNFSPETVSAGDLFAGALLPGLGLVGMYITWQIIVATFQGHKTPAIPLTELGNRKEIWTQALKILPAPLILIIAVLGSILGGAATPTEAASVGAIGALLIAGIKLSPNHKTSKLIHFAPRLLISIGAISIFILFVFGEFVDLRIGRTELTDTSKILLFIAIFLASLIPGAIISALIILGSKKIISPIVDQTARVTTMVFTILIGAALFSLVFRGLGGDETVRHILEATPGGLIGTVAMVMLVMFVLGFFLDFIEITLVVVPLVAPVLLTMGLDPIWLGVLMAVNLQTSFLTPPFGFALFYLRGVTPPEIKTGQIYRGALPFIIIQILMIILLILFPKLATWLPTQIYG